MTRESEYIANRQLAQSIEPKRIVVDAAKEAGIRIWALTCLCGLFATCVVFAEAIPQCKSWITAVFWALLCGALAGVFAYQIGRAK